MSDANMGVKSVPLQLFLLAHPKSETAVSLALELMRKFVDPPASGGLRLPLFFTPDTGDGMPPGWDGNSGIELDSAAHTLVVVLADARMVQSQNVDGGTGELWQEFLEEGIRRTEQSNGRQQSICTLGRQFKQLFECKDIVQTISFGLRPNH